MVALPSPPTRLDAVVPGVAVPPIKDLIGVAGIARAASSRVAVATKAFAGQGYVVDSIARKFALGHAQRLWIIGGRAWDWHAVPFQELRAVSVDATGSTFDSSPPRRCLPVSAAAMAKMVCSHDRGVWPLLVSMFICLWKPVSDAGKDDTFKAIASPGFAESVDLLRQRLQTNPHPVKAVMFNLDGVHIRRCAVKRSAPTADISNASTSAPVTSQSGSTSHGTKRRRK
jgi:hypothetical protein